MHIICSTNYSFSSYLKALWFYYLTDKMNNFIKVENFHTQNSLDKQVSIAYEASHFVL